MDKETVLRAADYTNAEKERRASPDCPFVNLPDGFPRYIVVRHTAGSAAEYVFPFQHIPAEILDRFSGDKEITSTLGQLCKVDGVIGGSFFIGIQKFKDFGQLFHSNQI